MKKTVIRGGDTVRILRSNFVKRVGYPLCVADLKREFEDHPVLRTVAATLGLIPNEQMEIPWRIKQMLLDGVAKATLHARRFGGKERSIHYKQIVEDIGFLYDMEEETRNADGKEAIVYSKRTVRTGTYYPACGSGEDYEPGGLDKAKTHVLLYTSYGEIADYDVELVRRGEQK